MRWTLSAPDRFFSHVQKGAGCWLWTARIRADGYGQFSFLGRPVLAHRWSYEHTKGPIPRGLQLDHLCRNRACVNPDHLEAVTQLENARRGAHAMKTRCVNGHEFSPQNTYRRPPNGTRQCRACTRAAAERVKQRKAREA